jgi:hypothetical protein
MAQVVIVNLQALVSDSDERRLIAAVACDADVDEGVLLDGSLLLLLLLLPGNKGTLTKRRQLRAKPRQALDEVIAPSKSRSHREWMEEEEGKGGRKGRKDRNARKKRQNKDLTWSFRSRCTG